MVTSHPLTTFYAAAASVAGALIGLLFVALTVAQDRSTVEPVTSTHEVRGAAALMSFTTALVLSLFALIEGPQSGTPATVVAVCGLLFVFASTLSLRGERHALRNALHLAWLIAGFTAQLIASLELSAHPGDLDDERVLAILVTVFFLIGISRSWELVGGPTITIAQQFAELIPHPRSSRASPASPRRSTPETTKPVFDTSTPGDTPSRGERTG